MVIEENLRKRMGDAAVAAAQAVGYVNAGTIEFLLDEQKNFYFLEMNTRLQVEHPVTEMITGVDLVHEQIRIAAGKKLTLEQNKIKRTGHAIECRIYAEDPDSDFLPSVGLITRLREPAGPGIRVDSGVYQGYEVPVYYDPLIAKLLAWAPDRNLAIRRMHRALSEFIIDGVKSSTGYLKTIMNDNRFRSGNFDTHFIEETESIPKRERKVNIQAAGILAALAYHTQGLSTVHPSGGGDSGINPWKLAGRREGTE